MILKVHAHGASCYEVGDEIWQQLLAGAIAVEAETIAGYATADLLQAKRMADRDALRERIITEMMAALGAPATATRRPTASCTRCWTGPQPTRGPAEVR